MTIEVTITGADDNVDTAELAALSGEFPQVEWAILVASGDRFGTPRYPSLDWINRFKETRGIRRALHLCGDASRLFQSGLWDKDEFAFARWQINGWDLSGNKRGSSTSLWNVGYTPRDFELILQCRSLDDAPEVVAEALTLGHSSVLVDASGGKGIEPDWDDVARTANHLSLMAHAVKLGFAGGIGPTNIERIIQTLGFSATWLCMESGIRTNDRLDLANVRDVLETVQYCNARMGFR